jgi:hypothetical protein
MPNVGHVYVVTNAHVSKDYRVVRYNSHQGVQVVDLSGVRWHDHPDGWDVSVCPLFLTVDLDERMAAFRKDGLLTRELAEEIPLRHGDELFMVSRYSGHPGDDEKPIVRFGTLAKTRPITMMRPGRNQEFFLAEMRSLPGHSGSPAYVFFSGLQVRLGADEEPPKAAVYMLGVDSFHPAQESRVKQDMADGTSEAVGTYYVEENSGIARHRPSLENRGNPGLRRTEGRPTQNRRGLA